MIANIFLLFLHMNSLLIDPNATEISYMGRFNQQNPHEYICSFPASSVFINTNSATVTAILQDYALNKNEPNYVAIIVDNILYKEFNLDPNIQEYIIYENTDKQFHTIQICKRTEGLIGNIGFGGFKLNENAGTKPVILPEKKILFVGNSITCGYGNEATNATDAFCAKTENAYMSFASIAARNLQSQYHLIAYSGKGIYRNWADTVFDKETLPYIFKRTLVYDSVNTWNNKNYIPNLIILNIGTNDFSPPLGANKQMFIQRYSQFIDTLMALYPQVPIICANSQMLAEPDRSLQIEWLQEIIRLKSYKNIYFCKFTQQGALGYGADWHPNIQQNKINAKELLDIVKECNLL